jgi:hypothetical protein
MEFRVFVPRRVLVLVASVLCVSTVTSVLVLLSAWRRWRRIDMSAQTPGRQRDRIEPLP